MPFKKHAGFTFSELLLIIVVLTVVIATLLPNRQAPNARASSALGNDAPAVAAIAKEEYLAGGNPVARQAHVSVPPQTSASLLATSEKSTNAESSGSSMSPGTRALGEALALFAALIVGLGWVARTVIKKAQRERASS